MSLRHVVPLVTAALVATLLAGCGAGAGPAVPAPAPAAPGPGAASPVVVAAHQGASALAALAALGEEQGGAQVRAAAARLAAPAAALDEQVRAAADGTGLDDALTAEQQSLLADLRARSASSFDPAWTRAVLDVHARLRADAEAVLAAPAVTEEDRAAARAALAGLDAAVAQLRATPGSAAGTPPTAVDSGTGGQAGDVPAPFVLLAAGVLLLGAAARAARRP